MRTPPEDHPAPYEMVTKLQAAERQLRVAIRLFFERRDLVAVHTLGAAAQDLLRDVGRQRGIKSIFKDNENIRSEHRERLGTLFREAQNFFKHADRDPEAQLKFYHGATQFYLLDAALLYVLLTGRKFPEVTGLLAWSLIKFPDIVAKGSELERHYRNLLRPGIDPDNFRAILAAIDMLPVDGP
jgi:hypothetical protein